MFFNSDFTLPFDNLEQVLKNFPEWNLVHIEGYEFVFKMPAMQVRNSQQSYQIQYNLIEITYRARKIMLDIGVMSKVMSLAIKLRM